MSATLRVGIVGRDGRMGRAASAWLAAAEGMECVAAVGAGEDWGSLAQAEVVLEVTAAGLGARHAKALLEMGLRPVVGTSGVSADEVRVLDELARARGLGGIVVPNFSAVMMLMAEIGAAAGRWLGETSITEVHHADKLDAPSGTARGLARRLGVGSSEIAAVRMNGVTAFHEVRLVGTADTLLLRHESLGLDGFRDGVLESLRYARAAEGVGEGLDVVLGEACKRGSAV